MLYIIVNGKPTASKVVWRSLVNVDHVKAAVQKLREINWLYNEVKDDSVDEISKTIIKIANNASSTMLDKADEHDISGFQAFSIRNLDNKLSTKSDIEQYKLLNVREDPIDNRQQYLDVMCFPTLYPTGKFGKYHILSLIKAAYLIKILASGKILSMYFTYCGKKKCESFLLVCKIS